MNNLRFWGGIATLALLMSACSDDSFKSESGEGSLMLDVSLKSEITASTTVTNSSRAADGEKEAWDVTLDDLFLMITSHNSGGTFQWYLSDFDGSQAFEVGTYDVAVRYGEEDDEGFCQPYYYGVVENVVVENEKSTPVTIVAELERALFYVNYSDNVVKNLSNYSISLMSENGDEAIEYSADETRPAYMRPESIDVTFNLTTTTGTSASVLVKTLTAEARHIYQVNVDVTGNFDTGATISVAFDDDLDVGETVEISLDAEALSAAAPTIWADGFDSGVAIDHMEGTKYGDDLIMNVYAPGKLAKLQLETTGTDLIFGWPESIDLMSATEAQQATLTSLGFWAVGIWKNPDEMAQINFKDVLHNIELITSTGEVTFTLTATDVLSQTSESCVLAINVEPFVVELSISDPSTDTLALGETELSLTVDYNALYIDDNVTIQYTDIYGNWQDATATYTEVSGQLSTYTAAVSGLSTSGDTQLRALYTDGTVSNTISITRTYPDVVLTVDEADVWTTHATITCLATDGSSVLDLASETVGVYISTNGTSYSVCKDYTIDGDEITFCGLTSGTTYYVKTTISGNESEFSDPISFTTEAELQLPNNDMETWTATQPTTKYQIIYYPGESSTAGENAWDTMNLLTTSTSGTGTSIGSYGGTAYRAHSGTEYTTYSNSGTYAARICTVGWGSSNTAAGTAGACSNITAGELYLGTYNSSTKSGDYGYAFTSRPSSLSFYYKLSVVNTSDYGYAEVNVYDASGNVIASNSTQLAYMTTYSGSCKMGTSDGAESLDYELVTLPLEYPENCPKAAQISVVFKSSGNSSCLTWSSSYLAYPAFANYTDGVYRGACLYIDDIILNY